MPRMLRSRSAVVAMVISGLLLLPSVIKAIYVTPHAVFIDHRVRSGEVTLGNAGETPEEVTVELRFGFPDTDSAGTPFIRFVDDPGPEFPSAAGWIRPFPRRIRLEPGTQQVVRLLATPPDDLPDGEYWTRMVVTSRGASMPIVTADTAVRAGVQLEIRLITAITYRKGEVHTSVAISELTGAVSGDSLLVWLGATRGGNAAYLGTATFDLVGNDGSTVREWAIPIAVYYPMLRRFAFPMEGVPRGDHLLRVTLSASRTDLLEEQVLSAPTVVDSLDILVP